MKIIMIRHGKVEMKWNKKYDSTSYDLACIKYDKCPIVSEVVTEIKTALLNEVPLRSFKDTKIKYPLWIWNVFGRLQWSINHKRQDEGKRATMLRAQKVIEVLEGNKEECYVITHGFYMRVLAKELKKRGYKLKKSRMFGISNMDQIVARKEQVITRFSCEMALS